MSMPIVGNLFEDLLRIGAGNVEPAAAGMERFNKFANKVSRYDQNADGETGPGHETQNGEEEARA